MQDQVTNSVRMQFCSRSENVAFARTATAVFASQLDFTIDQLDEIKLAVSEAVSNAIIHGYKNSPGMVRLELNIIGRTLEIIVSDSGAGIADVEWAMEAAHTTDANRMGLGFVFIKEYMDDLVVQSEVGKGTTLFMRKSTDPQVRH
ncbi:MAG TPA: anti-sigma F factor [Firmicutes bacterium]|jgi:stage II sporulation protein AB (anti-sigma F factor)|nr:anti-sigma F factor [Bacillota bacterium]